MPYLGDKPLSETAPNHPFSHSQISFGVKRPASTKTRSRTKIVPEESQSPVHRTSKEQEQTALPSSSISEEDNHDH